MRTERQHRFIWYLGIIMIVYVVLAFGAVAGVQPFRLERYVKPLVTVHILASMGWLLLFFYQSTLIFKRDVDRHRKNLAIATAFVVISAISSVVITYQWGSAVRFVGESRDALAFAVLFGFAIRSAKSASFETHKRLMLIAALNLIHPAHIRVPNIFDWPVSASLLITVFTWIAIPIAYDVMSQGKLHRATVAGIAFTLLSFALVIAVIISPMMPIIESFLYRN